MLLEQCETRCFVITQMVHFMKKETTLVCTTKVVSGTPEGTRTPDLLVRSQSLYPTELPAHTALLSAPLY